MENAARKRRKLQSEREEKEWMAGSCLINEDEDCSLQSCWWGASPAPPTPPPLSAPPPSPPPRILFHVYLHLVFLHHFRLTNPSVSPHPSPPPLPVPRHPQFPTLDLHLPSLPSSCTFSSYFSSSPTIIFIPSIAEFYHFLPLLFYLLPSCSPSLPSSSSLLFLSPLSPYLLLLLVVLFLPRSPALPSI